MENPMPKALRPTTTPAAGVTNPISSAAPAASPSRPPNHRVGVDIALPLK